MTKKIFIEKIPSKKCLDNNYRIYNNYYYLEIGNITTLLELYSTIYNFKNGYLKNNSLFFKLNFNTKYLYIRYLPTNKFLGIEREYVDILMEEIKEVLTQKPVNEKGTK